MAVVFALLCCGSAALNDLVIGIVWAMSKGA